MQCVFLVTVIEEHICISLLIDCKTKNNTQGQGAIMLNMSF